MTPSKEPEQIPGGRRWLTVGLAAGAGLVVLGGAVGVAGWAWSRNHLMPRLAKEISRAIDRPVELGPLESLGPTGIRVGASAIPPTATDPDSLSVGAIDVRLNPFDLLRRDVRLVITLDQIDVYLEQDADGQWVAVELDLPERDRDRDPFVEVSVGTVRLRDSQATLLPYGDGAADRPQVSFVDIEGQGDLSPVDLPPLSGAARPRRTQHIDFGLSGNSVQGGGVVLRGAVQLPVAPDPVEPPSAATGSGVGSPQIEGQMEGQLQGRASLRAQELRATDILPLVESFLAGPLPVQFPTGLVSGSVDIDLDGAAPPRFTGTARVKEGTVTGSMLPAPLEALQGDVRFRGRAIAFEGVTATMGDLSAQAGGTLDLDGGYDLSGQVDPFTVAQVSDLLGTALPIEASGTFGADVTMTGPLGRPVIATDLASQGTVTVDRVAFSDVQAQTTVTAPTLAIDRLQATPQAGGAIAGSGQFTFGQPGRLSLALSGTQLPGDALGALYGLPDTVALGPIATEVQIDGSPGQLTGNARWRAPLATYPAQGSIALADNALRFTDTFVQVAGGTVVGEGVLGLGDRRWQSTLRAVGLQLDQLGVPIGGDGAGVVNGEARLVGQLGGGIEGRGLAQAQVAGGVVEGVGALSGGQWNADLRGDALQLRAFAPDLQGTAGGQFRLRGTTADLTLAGVRGEGQAVISDGLAVAAPRAPQLAQLRAPLTADLAWNGQSVLVRRATTAGLQADGIVTPRLGGAGGPAIANLDLNLAVDGLSLAALPLPDLLPLGGNAFFNGRLRGAPGALALNGRASLVGFRAGDLAFASPLSGPVTFVQNGPLNVDLTGRGDNRIAVAARTSRDLDFEVVSDLGQPQRPNAVAFGTLRDNDFNATLRHLPLRDLKLPQGGLGGIGTVSGIVTEANIVANLRQPTLRATFDIADPSLGYLRLPVATEAVVNPADPDGPESLVTRYSRLRGTVTYADQVVGLVGATLESATGQGRYLASGTYTLGDTPQVNGNLVVENGQIQEILTTLLIFERADFRPNLLKPPPWFFAEEAGLASLEQVSPVGDRNASLLNQLRRLAEVLELQDTLLAEAEAAPFPPLSEFEGSFSGRISANGPLTNDLALAFDLAGNDWRWGDPALHPNGIVYRVDEVIAQGRYQNQVIQLNPISLRSDFTEFSANAQPGVALASLNGEFGLNPDDPVDRTLRLEVSDVPMDAVRQPLRLPNNIDGLINAGATLTGNRADPRVRGQLSVNSATVNRKTIDLAAANFGYQGARLNLLGRMAVQEQIDPLLLVASVPLPLPGVAQTPESDAVTVDLRMRDEGFALINLFTQGITWESGPASLDLAVRGQWPQNTPPLVAVSTLAATGSANLEGVTISSRSLPEPLTNLRGTIEVADLVGSGGDRTIVNNGLVLDFQNVRGDFSKGEVLATGQLRLLSPLLPASFELTDLEAASPDDDPFRLSLNNIALDLRSPAGTYRGGVNGDIVANGSVFLEPPLSISGAIRLSNGVATLPEAPERNGAPTANFTPTAEPGAYSPNPLLLDDFSLVLADNVRLAIPGFVDVRAEGDLNLTGTLPAIRPNGRINLPSGRINLLTTEFRLTGNDNYAEFNELDDVIDPYLSATLTAVVADSAAAGATLAVATPFPRNEISTSIVDQLGLTQAGVQTVRIRASVNGRASRVVNLQDVELSSTPPRSQSEIIALVSGGFLAALESTLGSVSGGGDGFQGLLAFAGSALLNNLQNLLGSGIERTDLRLYSASPPGGQQGTAIDIGGEVGFNLSPNISVSVQKVFTNVTPVLFSVRYRINDQFTLRAVTSYEQFRENSGAVLEFGSSGF